MTLEIECLERRRMLAVTCSLAGKSATFVMNSPLSQLQINYDPSTGRLKHNQFGNSGYASEFDFDIFTAGVQNLLAGSGTKVKVLDAPSSGNVVISDYGRPAGLYFVGESVHWGDGTDFDISDVGGYVRVITTGGNDYVYVNRTNPTNASIEVVANDGNDYIEIGSNGTLDEIEKSVFVLGGGGVDTVQVNDEVDTTSGNAYLVDSTSVTRAGQTVATFVSCDLLRVNTTDQLDTIEISTTSTLPRVEVNANGGVDHLTVRATAPGSRPVLDTGTGSDLLMITGLNGAPGNAIFEHAQDCQSISVSPGCRLDVLPTGNLTVEAGNLYIDGTLDLANNTLITHGNNWNPWKYNTLLGNGYNNGGWNGASGIVSSVAAASPASRRGFGFATAAEAKVNMYAGIPVSADDLILTYTIMGDTNLDHQVDFTDLLNLAQNYGTLAKLWNAGNLNFDVSGSVNFTDLLLLAQNYGQSFAIDAAAPALSRSDVPPGISSRPRRASWAWIE